MSSNTASLCCSNVIIWYQNYKLQQTFVQVTNDHAVVRFGLPINFQSILIVPYKKRERQLQAALHRLFNYLDSSADPTGIDVSCKCYSVHTVLAHCD